MKISTFDKALILLRGLPGSGKSTLARILSEGGKYPVFSVDDFFTDPQTGDYHFDHTINHLAYKQCEENAANALLSNNCKVIIDNTFTIPWEMEPYFKLASSHGYPLFVVTVENYHNQSNIHQIPEEQLQKMAAKYRVKLLPSTD